MKIHSTAAGTDAALFAREVSEFRNSFFGANPVAYTFVQSGAGEDGFSAEFLDALPASWRNDASFAQLLAALRLPIRMMLKDLSTAVELARIIATNA